MNTGSMMRLGDTQQHNEDNIVINRKENVSDKAEIVEQKYYTVESAWPNMKHFF